MNIVDLVRESNRIEGITRDPTKAEIVEFQRFLDLGRVTTLELERFVTVYQPNAVLRAVSGLDVRVGNHFPPRGGPHIRAELDALLMEANGGDLSAFDVHCQYETLHPFTDGNGRSGRMLWYWQMRRDGQWQRASALGFLHTFYYQSLDSIGRKS